MSPIIKSVVCTLFGITLTHAQMLPISERANFLVYGKGNCKPTRPQMELCYGADFQACQQACLKHGKCIGFDYDPASDGCCRIRFSHNDDLSEHGVLEELAPLGFHPISGEEGDGFNGTEGSHTATCYVKPTHPGTGDFNMLWYGNGNCAPNRPQLWNDGATFSVCQHACLNSQACIGFDYDQEEKSWCRIRFASNQDALTQVLPMSGTLGASLQLALGEEGPGFSGTAGSATATCYVKPDHPSTTNYDLFVYGSGDCQPNRPQWKHGPGASFGLCQQTCVKNDGCIGFDYDAAYGGFCRIYFSSNDEIKSSLMPSEFTVLEGEAGPGFSYSSGPDSAKCYVKANRPSSTTYNLYVYGQGNCLPDRPQRMNCNDATFSSCQQACLNDDNCMGFDYDPTFEGCCRIRFASNDDAFSNNATGFTAIAGVEGTGFAGTNNKVGATCYVKPNFPGLMLSSSSNPLSMLRDQSALPLFATIFAGTLVLSMLALQTVRTRHSHTLTEAFLATNAKDGEPSQA